MRSFTRLFQRRSAGIVVDRSTANHISRADKARNRGDWHAAIAGYEEALSITPRLAHIWIQLGHARKSLGDIEGAARAYEAALRMSAGDERQSSDARCWLNEIDGSPEDPGQSANPASDSTGADAARDDAAGAHQGQNYDPHLAGDGGIVGLIERIEQPLMAGWIHRPEPFASPVRLELWASGERVAEAIAKGWRSEFELARLGNACVGFVIVYPPSLYGRGPIEVDLRDADSGASLLAAPISLNLPALPHVEQEADQPSPADGETPAVELTVIVNFYNMQREAERTLTSLSRSYQRDIDGLSYEVICVDNGSSPPLDAEWIASVGPEFRLFRPANPHPSPVFALNQAAAQARGTYLSIMIDGAHILSPRVLAEAMAAIRSQEGAIVALRLWFVGGDQRWLSQIGYTREHEDIIFSKIDWPVDGYRLFHVSTPMFETPSHWLEGLAETNCLFMSREAFHAIGGYDEAFAMPGAGFANLDFFVRAARAPGASVIALIGECTFHQYHGGTTTNVSDAEKDSLVRSYAAQYEELRGQRFSHVDVSEIRFRGKLPGYEGEIFGRQRPAFVTALGLTDEVRPASLWLHLDEGAQRYLQSVYVETGARHRTMWAGLPTDLAPADLVEIQQMLWAVRPEALVLKNVKPGLANFVSAVCESQGIHPNIVAVTEDETVAFPAGITRIVGDPMDGLVHARVEDAICAPERSCVLFQPLRGDSLPVDALVRYSRFVTPGGYMVVLDTGLGQPDVGYSKLFLKAAIRQFRELDPRFIVDTTMNAHLVTTCASGFLRRLPDARFDATIDPDIDLLAEI